MPQVTVYIRQADLDKWKSIEKKTEFISQALGGASSQTSAEHIKQPAASEEEVYCKHDFLPRLCQECSKL
jgi:hypothetical protein